MTGYRQSVAIVLVLAVLPLTGCRVGPKYRQPAPLAQAPPVSYKEAPAQFADTGEWKVAQPQDAMLQGNWWEIFGDPELNALEDKLNIDNQTIKQYFANFMEARTLIAQARSELYPTLGVGPGFTRSKSSGNLTNSATANTGHESSITSAPMDASWAPDLWGKVRNLISEEQYNAQISAADLEGERLTEQGSLAVYFFEIRGQDALQAVYDQTVVADRKELDLTRAQYETGVGDEVSVVEAENALQNVQAASTALGVARAQYEHAIAVLIGANPSSFSIPVRALNASPPPVPIGVPSQLLERRPDVAASERMLAAANAQIGIADAAFYPTLTLTAAAGFQSSTLKHLFDWPSRFWSIGPTASETIFDAGLRRATVNEFIEAYNSDVAGYRQTVLTAFQEVEDALAAVRILSQQVGQQQEAVQSAQRVVDLEIARYETGVDPYIDVVTVETTLLADQQALATVQMQAMTESVDLIQALGGGWDRTQLPTPKAVSKNLTAAESTIQR